LKEDEMRERHKNFMGAMMIAFLFSGVLLVVAFH
jgi:hypothetical protein